MLGDHVDAGATPIAQYEPPYVFHDVETVDVDDLLTFNESFADPATGVVMNSDHFRHDEPAGRCKPVYTIGLISHGDELFSDGQIEVFAAGDVHIFSGSDDMESYVNSILIGPRDRLMTLTLMQQSTNCGACGISTQLTGITGRLP